MYNIYKENGDLLAVVDRLRFVTKNSKGVKILAASGNALSVNGAVYRLNDDDFLECEKVTFSLVPAELREQAYNTERVIEWDGAMLTVTEAATLWQYYAAEGSEKAGELTALIASAKAKIRAEYPD